MDLTVYTTANVKMVHIAIKKMAVVYALLVFQLAFYFETFLAYFTKHEGNDESEKVKWHWNVNLVCCELINSITIFRFGSFISFSILVSISAYFLFLMLYGYSSRYYC